MSSSRQMFAGSRLANVEDFFNRNIFFKCKYKCEYKQGSSILKGITTKSIETGRIVIAHLLP